MMSDDFSGGDGDGGGDGAKRPAPTTEQASGKPWHKEKYGTHLLLSVDDDGVNHDVVEALVSANGYEARGALRCEPAINAGTTRGQLLSACLFPPLTPLLWPPPLYLSLFTQPPAGPVGHVRQGGARLPAHVRRLARPRAARLHDARRRRL